MHYAMKTYGGVLLKTHIFLTSALVGGERSASLPSRFNPGERAPSTHSIGVWVRPESVEVKCVFCFSLQLVFETPFAPINISEVTLEFLGARVA
jgi:hypothetical protein